MSVLFGTDGVRGKANVELSSELAYKLGCAATILFSKNCEIVPQFLIGRDTRISGEMLEASLTAGICSFGGNVIPVGVVPTPAVAYLVRKVHATAGIMISASHNPYYDNGIKFFNGDGYKLSDKIENEIEKIVLNADGFKSCIRPSGEFIGHIEHRKNLLEDYISFVMSTTSERFDGMRVVLDCANGSASEIMPKILERLGVELILINYKPNGININDHCGSTHMDSLRLTVLRNHADIGIAHDGDADRCLCVDEHGKIIDGDHIMIICAKLLLESGELPDKTIVTTVMSNIGFCEALRKYGLSCEVTPVGDRYVLGNMLLNHHKIGGEQSGHIIFSDYSTTGDGLITALQILTAMKKFKSKASELNALMKTYPQVLISVKVKDKNAYKDSETVKLTIAEAEMELGEFGRILIRASGTEPLVRVMAEGANKKQLEKICSKIASEIEKVSCN